MQRTVCTRTIPPGFLAKLWRQGLDTVLHQGIKIMLEFYRMIQQNVHSKCLDAYPQHKRFKLQKTDVVCAWYYYQYHNYVRHILMYCHLISYWLSMWWLSPHCSFFSVSSERVSWIFCKSPTVTFPATPFTASVARQWNVINHLTQHSKIPNF